MSLMKEQVIDKIRVMNDEQVNSVFYFILNLDEKKNDVNEKKRAFEYLNENTYKIDLPEDYDYKKEYIKGMIDKYESAD